MLSSVLHFQPVGLPVGQETFRPPSLSCSPSHAAAHSSIHQQLRKEVPQYSHWFALEARHVYETLTLEGENFELAVEAVAGIKHTSTVGRDALNTFITAYKCIQELDHNPAVAEGYLADTALRKREQVTTSLLTRALDRFLFPDQSTGGCYHQLPGRPGTIRPEAPDLTVMAVHAKVPTRSIVVADGKNSSLSGAEVESCMYAVTILQQLQSNSVLLGLPFNRDKLAHMWATREKCWK